MTLKDFLTKSLTPALAWLIECHTLARFEARAVVVDAQVSSFPIVDLAFAWTQAPNMPLILGQANFFFEFDVCFFRARSEFEVRSKQVSSDFVLKS